MQSNLSRPLKPLLFVLRDRQPPIDLQALVQSALQGRANAETSRAAIELEKVITSINAEVGGACSSLQSMAALMLPEQLATMLWMSYLLFIKETRESDDDHFIQKRNRASKAVLQALANVDLVSWHNTFLDQFPLSALPYEIRFPPGHPLPGKAYRQHPLYLFNNFYYPSQSFYSYVLDERKSELIRIMADLGASEIVIYDFSQSSVGANASGGSPSVQTLRYPGKAWIASTTLDYSKYCWLPNEVDWKTVISERITHGCLEATIQIDIDFSRVLTEQLHRIKSLVNQFFSIDPAIVDNAWHQIMQTHQFRVKFPQ